jgi:adenine deaminase
MTRFAQAVVFHVKTSIVSGLDMEYISAIKVDWLDEIFAEIDDLPLKVL